MNYDQKEHPLLLGILYGTAIYGSIVLAILCTVGISVATVLIIPMCILFLFALISQMRNISYAKKEENVDYCLKTYFVYKYIMMPVELICAGIVGAFIFGIIKMIIHWPEDRLIATFLVFIITLIVTSVITFIIAIILYMLIVFTLIELPCFISIGLRYYTKKIRYVFCRNSNTFFIADDTGVGYYRRIICKYKVLE